MGADQRALYECRFPKGLANHSQFGPKGLQLKGSIDISKKDDCIIFWQHYANEIESLAVNLTEDERRCVNPLPSRHSPLTSRHSPLPSKQPCCLSRWVNGCRKDRCDVKQACSSCGHTRYFHSNCEEVIKGAASKYKDIPRTCP